MEVVSTWPGRVEPVCVAVGGRAGVGKSTLVDALAERMEGLGPLTIGELPASNSPEGPSDVAVPIDIAVQMIHRVVQDSDRAAIRGHRARGIPVLGVLARADEIEDCWAVATACVELPLVPVALASDAPAMGLQELAGCLSAGIAEILAGRADRRLAALDRAAAEGGLEGCQRDHLERVLAGPDALSLRMTGMRNWDESSGSAERALAAATRWRSVANATRDPAEAARARNWHRRHVARAVQLGAGRPGAGRAGAG